MIGFALIKVLLGIIILTWSADKLVAGAASLAKHLKIAPLIIGLTVLAFGTCLPEVVVSVLASLRDTPDIALGNVIGSNIANIGVVIGLCALIQPLKIQTITIKKELPLMGAMTLAVCLMIWLFGLNLWMGVLLIGGALFFVGWLVRRAQSDRKTQTEVMQEIPEAMSIPQSLLYVFFGLVLLIASARLLIDGAVDIATFFGVPEIIIGLSVVAFGTSLPELATSVAALLKKEHSIAVGNIVGSNIFNITLVLSAPAIVTPNFPIDHRVLISDIPVMLLFSLLFILLGYQKRHSKEIGRKAGVLFLSLYCLYIFSLGFGQAL